MDTQVNWIEVLRRIDTKYVHSETASRGGGRLKKRRRLSALVSIDAVS